MLVDEIISGGFEFVTIRDARMRGRLGQAVAGIFFCIHITYYNSRYFLDEMDFPTQIIRTGGIFFDDEMDVKDFVHLFEFHQQILLS